MHVHGPGHSHSHAPSEDGHAPDSDRSSAAGIPRSLKIALLVTLVFMVIEAVGGWYTGSLALISDALHMFTDSGSLILSAFTLWLAARPAKAGYTYGYQRVEILGALLNGLLIWLLSGFLIFESFERFNSPQVLDGNLIFGIATIGLFANLISLFFLHQDHDHSLNMRAAYLHVASDCLGSVAAMASGLVIRFTGQTWCDPAITCLISVLILWSSWRLVREAVEVLLERAPRGISEEEVEQKLVALAGVTEVHDLHIWTLSSGRASLSVHLTATQHQGILESARNLLKRDYGITHTTIQVEADGQGNSAHCEDCES